MVTNSKRTYKCKESTLACHGSAPDNQSPKINTLPTLITFYPT